MGGCLCRFYNQGGRNWVEITMKNTSVFSLIQSSHTSVHLKDRVTVVVLDTVLGRFIGVALCNTTDKFDYATGQKLAYDRALKACKAYEKSN